MVDSKIPTTLTPKLVLIFSELFYGKGKVASAQLSVIYKDEDDMTCQSVLTAEPPNK